MNSQRIPVTRGTSLTMRFPSEVSLSPDGKRVAYVVRQWIHDQPKLLARIWIADADGNDPAPLTKGAKSDTHPCWSPDGQQVAYVSVSEGEKSKPQLFVIPATGGESRQVCTMPNGINEPAWSPDGSRISFLSLEGEEPKTDPIVVSPDRHRRLWTVRPEYDLPEPVTPDNLTVWEYAWSPDGKYLALYYSTGPDETDWYLGQVGIVPASGGAVRQISQLTCQASSLTWTPDSTSVTCVTGEWSDRGLVGGEIILLPIDGGETRNLTPDADRSFSWCQWFPDGQRLLFVAWKGVTHQLGMLDTADGTIQVIEDNFVMGETFGPRFSATTDLRYLAATHSTSLHPYDVWFGEMMGDPNARASIEWRQLTHLNSILEETYALSEAERIRYESVDGWQIDAVYFPPLEVKDGALPPLVVHVHGGPTWAYTDSWLLTAQLLAARGYAVLQPNIRGSLGHGLAFTNAVLGDMGGKDLQDILQGVDYLVERGVVDGERVAIMGWSYGGFMTSWAVTQTTRFKAAMMGAGVSDYHSFHAQSNIPDWDVRFIGVDPLEHPEAYRERSAITYAARVTTPTLILHGENDLCVPVNQAYAFYRALRERGIPVELVVYPREGHGLNEREHILDMEERLLKWFERYL